MVSFPGSRAYRRATVRRWCRCSSRFAAWSAWIVTESGRQPWVAYGILRTADAVSPVPGASMMMTLVLFVLVYGVVFTMGIYYINRLIALGPQGRAAEPPESGTPVRPLSAVIDAAREIPSPQR